MLARVEHVRRLTAVAIAMWALSGAAHAVERGGRDATSKSAPSQANAQPTADDEDDDEAFFSAGTNSSVATAGPPSFTAFTPGVDVTAVCRAVLADNSNLYNYKFLEGCKQVVTQGVVRRNAR